jgi:threonine dehydratase
LAGSKLFFKCEQFQKVGAFKFRGACNAVMKLNNEQAQMGVVQFLLLSYSNSFSVWLLRGGVRKNEEEKEDTTLPCLQVTHSSGNHAQALALAAKLRGIKAYIVMPEGAPTVKRNAVLGYGSLPPSLPPLSFQLHICSLF